MAVLINFKICDNAKECGGVAVCPTGALTWNETKQTLEIDNSKCISCGRCEKECPIGAISVAKNDEEYQKLKKEIDDDPRSIKDLFVDRYGAAPLNEFFTITEDSLKNNKNDGILLVECYEEELIQCLLKSIPIKEITIDMPKTTKFYKIEASSSLKKDYDLTEFPTLLVFKDGKYLGKIEGYYEVSQKHEFIENINKILGENN